MTEHDPLVRARLKAAIDDARINVDDGWDTLHTYRSVEAHRRTLTVAVALAIAIAGLAFGGWVFTRNDTRPGSGGQPDTLLFERYTQDTRHRPRFGPLLSTARTPTRYHNRRQATRTRCGRLMARR